MNFKQVLYIVWLLMVLIGNIHYAYASPPHYKFSHGKTKEGIVVELKLMGSKNGVTEIYLPAPHPAVHDKRLYIVTESFSSALITEAEEEMKRCAANVDTMCKVVKIHHSPSAPITITYSISKERGVFIAKHTGVLMFGEALFLIPKFANSNDVAVTMDWSALNVKQSKIIPPAINKAESDIVNENYGVFHGSVRDLLKSQYFFGDGNVLSTQINSYPQLNIITIGVQDDSSKDKILTHNKLVELSRIININNQHFIDNILQNKTNNRRSITFFNGVGEGEYGVANGGSYIVAIDAEKSSIPDVADITSHEFLHQLFAQKLSASFGPSKYLLGSHNWFDEGMTYYYSSLLNLEAGIITRPEYLKIFNRRIAEYYRLAQMQEGAVSLYDCKGFQPYLEHTPSSYVISEHMLYGAGNLFASNLDNIIQTKSHNKYKLQDLLKKAVSLCKKRPCHITKEHLVEASKMVYDKPWLDKYLSINIDDFNVVKPLPFILGRKAELSYKRAKAVIDYGFDLRETFCSGIVCDVEVGSNAYKAGLRSGDNLALLDVDGEEVKLTIEDTKQNKKTIAYKALGDKKIPQYIIRK